MDVDGTFDQRFDPVRDAFGSVGWASTVGGYAYGFVTGSMGEHDRSDAVENALSPALVCRPSWTEALMAGLPRSSPCAILNGSVAVPPYGRRSNVKNRRLL